MALFVAIFVVGALLIWLIHRMRPPFRPMDRTKSLDIFRSTGAVRSSDGGFLVAASLFQSYVLPASDIDGFFEWWTRTAKRYANLVAPTEILSAGGLLILGLHLEWPIVVSMSAAIASMYSVRVVWRRWSVKHFKASFPKSDLADDPNRWRRRVMATLIRRASIWRFFASFIVSIFGLVFFVVALNTFSMNRDIQVMYVIFTIVVFAMAVFTSYLCFQHVLFRIRHRRAPNEADFEALS